MDAIWNEYGESDSKTQGIKYGNWMQSAADYIQWMFDNPGEWEIIENQLVSNNGEITFDWLMEEILFKKRILGENSKYSLSTDVKNFVAKTSLKSLQKVRYVRKDNEKALKGVFYDRNDPLNKAEIFLKYGPFVVFLTDNDFLASFEDESLIISK